MVVSAKVILVWLASQARIKHPSNILGDCRQSTIARKWKYSVITEYIDPRMPSQTIWRVMLMHMRNDKDVGDRSEDTFHQIDEYKVLCNVHVTAADLHCRPARPWCWNRNLGHPMLGRSNIKDNWNERLPAFGFLDSFLTLDVRVGSHCASLGPSRVECMLLADLDSLAASSGVREISAHH
jgi:hypothetical protein